MKTLYIISAFMMMFSITYATGNNSQVYGSLEEEVFIDDIPFNTGDVVANYLYNDAMNAEFCLEEEPYIDDIPFDTECISADCHYQKAINVPFYLPEEETISDAPTYLID